MVISRSRGVMVLDGSGADDRTNQSNEEEQKTASNIKPGCGPFLVGPCFCPFHLLLCISPRPPSHSVTQLGNLRSPHTTGSPSSPSTSTTWRPATALRPPTVDIRTPDRFPLHRAERRKQRKDSIIQSAREQTIRVVTTNVKTRQQPASRTSLDRGKRLLHTVVSSHNNEDRRTKLHEPPFGVAPEA